MRISENRVQQLIDNQAKLVALLRYFAGMRQIIDNDPLASICPYCHTIQEGFDDHAPDCKALEARRLLEQVELENQRYKAGYL